MLFVSSFCGLDFLFSTCLIVDCCYVLICCLFKRFPTVKRTQAALQQLEKTILKYRKNKHKNSKTTLERHKTRSTNITFHKKSPINHSFKCLLKQKSLEAPPKRLICLIVFKYCFFILLCHPGCVLRRGEGWYINIFKLVNKYTFF